MCILTWVIIQALFHHVIMRITEKFVWETSRFPSSFVCGRRLKRRKVQDVLRTYRIYVGKTFPVLLWECCWWNLWMHRAFSFGCWTCDSRLTLPRAGTKCTVTKMCYIFCWYWTAGFLMRQRPLLPLWLCGEMEGHPLLLALGVFMKSISISVTHTQMLHVEELFQSHFCVFCAFPAVLSLQQR